MAGMKEVHIVTCITMDPEHPRVLYAGTTGGTYRSEDGGGSWQKKNSGLIPDEVLNAAMALGVNVLAVDPLNSGYRVRRHHEGTLSNDQPGGVLGTDRTGTVCSIYQ